MQTNNRNEAAAEQGGEYHGVTRGTLKRIAELEAQVAKLQGFIDMELPMLKRTVAAHARMLERIGERSAITKENPQEGYRP